MPFSLCYIKEDIDIDPDEPIYPSGDISYPSDPEPEPDDGDDDDSGGGSGSAVYVKFTDYPFEIAVDSDNGTVMDEEIYSGKIKLSRIYERKLTNGTTVEIPDTERQYESEVFKVDGAKVKLILNGMVQGISWDWTLVISPAAEQGDNKWITAVDEFLSQTADANPKGATGLNNIIEIV